MQSELIGMGIEKSHQQTGIVHIKRQVRTNAQDEQAIDHDWVIEEQAIALIYHGISHAVMMATPVDLYDLAVGFSLSESIIERPKEILSHDIVNTGQGVEVRLNISSRQFTALKHKRRSLLGNSGCGLCDVISS